MTETNLQQGKRWVRESIALFKVQPHRWMLWSLAYIMLFMVLPSLPRLGVLGLFTVIIWPACMAFVVMLYRQADLGLPIAPGLVIDKLRPHFKTLMSLGLACLIYAVMATFVLGSDLASLVAHAPQKAGMSESQLTTFVEGVLSFSIKAILLFLPLFIGTWFSPMLIALNGYTLGKAVKSSVAGMLKYTWAMGVSWLLITLAMILIMLLVGLVIGIVSALVPMLAQLLMPLLVFAVLLMTNALMYAFQYISYRDVFQAAPLQEV